MTASVQPSLANAEAFQLFSSAKRKRLGPGDDNQPRSRHKGSRKKPHVTPHSRLGLAAIDAERRQEGQDNGRGEGLLEDRTRGTGAASSEEEAVLASGVDGVREVGAIETPAESVEQGGKKQGSLDQVEDNEEGTAFRDLGLSDWLCRYWLCFLLRLQTGCRPCERGNAVEL
jgi:hypothetical protein